MIATCLLALAVALPAERVLVLDVQGEGVDKAIPVAVRDTLVSHLQANATLEVLSSEDMRRALDVEAEKQALGCEADASCLAELAGALGARFLVYGSAAKLGEVVAINLSLFDASRGVAVARESVEVVDVGLLPLRVRSAATTMFAQVGVSLPVASTDDGLSPLIVVGGVSATIGALTLLGCGLLAGISADDVKTQPTFAAKTESAQRRDLFALTAVGAGVVALGGAATLGFGLMGE